MIGIGTMMMITRKEETENNESRDGSWLIYAVLSAVFASLTAILGKIGISGIDSNLGTAIRTTVVLVMAWLMVFMKGKQHEVREIEKKNFFLSDFPELQQEHHGFFITEHCKKVRRALLYRSIS